jgi:hypothetical protein
MTLELPAEAPCVRFYQGLLLFDGRDGYLTIRCAVTEAALLDKANLPKASGLKMNTVFNESWDAIKSIAVAKYAAGDLLRGAVVVVSSEELNGTHKPVRHDCQQGTSSQAIAADR